MTVKIFATGATGYIGGDALQEIITAHPDWHYTLLVRDSDKGRKIESAYEMMLTSAGAKVAVRWPSVTLVYGDWSSTTLLENSAVEADVVLHFADADSTAAATALTTGLSRKVNKSGHLIHTSGTGILAHHDISRDSYGTIAPSSDEFYDDISSIDSIRSLPDVAPHRAVDKIVFAAGASGAMKTAIVCPPCIYGIGRGPDNTRSVQLPLLAQVFLSRKKGLMVGKGHNKWMNIHISDLSRLYLSLTEAAAGYMASSSSSGPANAGKATWNDNGYYFCENGAHIWGDVCKAMAAKGKEMGLWETDEVEEVPAVVANAIRPAAAILWGTNSLCKARRARELLGWEAKGPALEATIEEVLEVERKRVGIGHAKRAAGEM